LHKNLVHISQKSSFVFVTFRTKDSIDEYVQNLVTQDIKTNKLQYLIDKHLDNSKNGAYLDGKVLQLTKNHLLKLDKNLCEILSFIIMPNHIHLLLVQKSSLDKIMKHIKGGLAFLINKELGKSGAFWQKDYFDKTIRDDEHLAKTLEYIKNNALKAGLIDSEERFYFNEDVEF